MKISVASWSKNEEPMLSETEKGLFKEKVKVVRLTFFTFVNEIMNPEMKDFSNFEFINTKSPLNVSNTMADCPLMDLISETERSFSSILAFNPFKVMRLSIVNPLKERFFISKIEGFELLIASVTEISLSKAVEFVKIELVISEVELSS